MRKSTFVLLVLALLFLKHSNVFAYNGNFEQEVENSISSTKVESFKNQLSAVYLKYLALKDALVASDRKNAGASAGEVKADLLQIDYSSLPEDEQAEFKLQSEKMIKHLNRMIGSTDLTRLRQNFEKVTLALYTCIKAHRVSNGVVYYQYCPMALDNNGGTWLSNEKEILNPYYGKGMLHCGSVKEEIK